MDTVIQIISLVTMLAAAIMIVWRVCAKSGVNISRRFDKTVIYEKHTPTVRECAAVFGGAIAFRLFVLFAAFVYMMIFSKPEDVINFDYLLHPWTRWDATQYMDIAKSYTTNIVDGDYPSLVFFPLFPMLLRVSGLLFSDLRIAGMLISFLCYGGACVYMYKMVCMDYTKSIALKAVVLMSVFPFSFFFGGIMTEALFLFTSIGALYYSRRHKWLLAGVFGMLAALTRSVGVFLIFPATVEFVEEYKLFDKLKSVKSKAVDVLKNWTPLLLMPVGTCIYLTINYVVSGNAFEFLKLQEKYWNQASKPFFINMGNIWDIVTGGYGMDLKMAAFIPGFIIVVVMYVALIYSIPKHKSMYSVWLMVYIIVNTTMSWPMSICRYFACAVPFYIILADKSEKHKWLYTALTVGFSILFTVYLISYLSGKQVM